jgi:hypothetical protein
MKLKVLFYPLISLLIFCLSSTATVFARGGGGGSGGGGGGGSGGGGSCYSLLSCSILITIYLIIAAIASYTAYKARKARIKKAQEVITAAEAVDPAWNHGALEKRAAYVFSYFQRDWSNFNVDSMQTYLTSEYHKRMVLEMNALRNQGRQNLMEDVEIFGLTILEAEDNADNSKDKFQVEVKARATDSLVDIKTNKYFYTDRSPFTEYWNFIRENGEWKLDTISQATANGFLMEDEIKSFASKNGFYYDADFGWLMMPSKGAIFRKTNFKKSDINNHVIGYFKEKIVEFYTYIPSGKQNRANYLVAQTILPVSYNDILVRKKRSFWNFAPLGLRRIRTESNDFEAKFCLYADRADQINSFVLLAPDFMEEVYNLPFELNIEIVGNLLYFYALKREGIDYEKMLYLLSRAFNSMRIG